ncbi:Sporulation cortex protein CoxA precursor [Bacillus sp. THAF10]|uniref:YhcN/YlaJ family sporulation lipoprotein n=1 Tax=Bacillus sp. THAF10 TaxID=2587848 RepID=UPI001268EFF3|nr:YhcN/YlaJ family sporulation lipoprotein [Bacillus sp. THAF10]QFT90028.1 Sporulation cortex protein CoxA precursor [Bacillus sp. THAF10]
MRKSLFTVTSAALLLGGLTGCGQKESATDNRYYEETSPIGYYTSEHNPYVNNDRSRGEKEEQGNARVMEDNDGPLNEILDRSVIWDERRVRRDRDDVGNVRNRGNNGGYLGVGYHNNHYSQTDKYYHRQDNGLRPVGNPSYYNMYDGRFSERLVNRAMQVDGVKDAGALINDNEVLVAVDVKNGADESDVKRQVKRALNPLVKNKELNVTTNQSAYNSVRSIDNELRKGEWHVKDLEHNMRGIYRTMDR